MKILPLIALLAQRVNNYNQNCEVYVELPDSGGTLKVIDATEVYTTGADRKVSKYLLICRKIEDNE